MHPTISYWLAQARIADLRHDAQLDTLARASRLGRRPRMPRRTRPMPGPAQVAQPAVAGEVPAR